MSKFVKSFIFLFIFLIVFLSANAQSGYKPIIYKAYVDGDMHKWASVIYTIEKDNPTSTDKKLELVSYYYGYIGYLLGTKKYETAQKYMTKGEKMIEDLLKVAPKNATLYAFKGSFIGFRIGISHFKAITLGSESSANVNKAYQLDPQNIQAIVDKGNALYHTPKLFGGDKKESLKLFLKGAKLLEANHHTEDNWFYLNVLTLVARNYESLEQYEQAKQTYEKILHFEPDYKWVKNELYPALKAKIK